MKRTHFLITPLLLLSVTACKQRTVSAENGSTAQEIHADTPLNTLKDTSKTSTQKALNATQLMVAGKSVGLVKLNEAGTTVFRILGKPDTGDAAMGKSVSIWYKKHNSKENQTQIFFAHNGTDDGESYVQNIHVTSPDFKTRDSICSGTPIERANRLYKLKKIGTFLCNGMECQILDDINAGIAFDVDTQGVVKGISIHKPGYNPITAYNAFFDHVKPGS